MKLEFEQEENEDPLRRIVKVLEKAAETLDEKRLAQAGIQRLEEFRSGWAKMIQEESDIIKIKEIVRAAGRNNRPSMPVNSRTYGPDNLIEDFPSVVILGVLMTDGDKGEKIEPSVEFMERVLRGLGALESDQKLDALKLLPQGREGYRGPVYRDLYRSSYADRVPTDITGVDLTVDFSWLEIRTSVDVPTLQKAINFPKS